MSMAVQWLLEAVVVILLTATLWHAIRLERRLGVLRRDNASLEALVAGFNEATTRAETSTARLRATAEGAGRQLTEQVEAADRLRGDLLFLMERGESLADRLDIVVREARDVAQPLDLRNVPRAASQVSSPAPEAPEAPRLRSQAERDLLQALRVGR